MPKRTKAQRKAAERFRRLGMPGITGTPARKINGADQQSVSGTAPTAERMAKQDVVKTEAGAHVVEDLLDRLYRQKSLDPQAGMNWRMFNAGLTYRDTAHLAGLSGIAAQDVSRIGGGGGDPAYAMPPSTTIADARARWRKAWSLMGGKVAPVVHGLLVEGRSPEDIGREATTYHAAKSSSAAALTILRIGLWSLASVSG